MSLVARHLEANGIPTVVIGSARDIVELVGVARFLFVDYPLGNPMGKPFDAEEQDGVASAALTLLASAAGGRTTRQLDLEWGDDTWRDRYMHVGPDNEAALAAAGVARRARRGGADGPD